MVEMIPIHMHTHKHMTLQDEKQCLRHSVVRHCSVIMLGMKDAI